MKKLLFAIAGAAVFSAFAADPSAGANDIDVLGFENFDLTNPNVTGAVINRDDTGVEGTSKWSCSGDDASTVKAYGGENAAAPTGISFPAPFDGAGANYLALDTNGAELQRAIPAAGQTIAADGTYVDTLVQFTPSESAPGEGDLTGAKLAIWLGVVENVTNLYVQAEQYTDEDSSTHAPQSFALVTQDGTAPVVDPSTWYRLTVKAIPNVFDAGNPDCEERIPAFQISLDGVLLCAQSTDAPFSSEFIELYGNGGEGAQYLTSDMETALTTRAVFPQLGEGLPIETAATLTSVGFKGTGAIDDFVVTTVAPEFTPAGGDDYKVTIDGSDVVVTPSAEDLAAVQAAVIAGGGTLDVTDVDAVNAALAAPIGTTGIPSWQALFLGLPPTAAGLESFKIDSISFDEDGNVVVELPDTVDPKTGRGVDITIKLKSADTPNAESWADVESASGTTFAPFAPGSTDTKKFYKVVVEFAGSSASAGQD